MADAGFKLGVEGEKEFRRAINDINAILKLNQAELQNVTAAYNASDKGIDALTKKQEGLEKAIYTQVGALAEMSGEYSRLKDAYGENDKGVIKLRTEIEKASATMANMDAQLAETIKAIEDASANTADFDTKIADADAQIKALQAELKAVDAGMKDASGTLGIFGHNAEETAKKVKDLKDRGELLTNMIEEQKKKMDALNDEMGEAVKLYGSQSKEVAEYRTEIANATTELKSMELQLEQNNDEIDRVEKGAGDLAGVFDKISDITGIEIPAGLTDMLGGVGLVEGAVAGGLVAAFGAAAKKVIEIKQELIAFAEELTKMSWDTGLDTETLQALQGIADYFNVDVDTIKDSLKDLRKNMVEAADGNEELRQTFGELGVEVLDGEGKLRSVMAVYMDLSDAFFQITSKEERLVKMEKLLGESANQSAQIAAAGKAELTRVINKYYDTYNVRSKETIAQLDAEGKAWAELEMKMKGVYNLFVEMNREAEKDSWIEKLGTYAAGGALGYIISLFRNLSDAKGNFASTPKYAAGTYNHPGGYAMVGENGPEIVDLPAGSRVYPSGQYPDMGATNNYYVTISASDVREFNDIVRIAQSKRVTERMK